MSQAGDFNRQFKWLVRSYTQDALSGAMEPSWSGSTLLWGSLTEGSPGKPLGNYGEQWGTTRNRTNAFITLNQFPAISQEDRLVDILFGQTYVIDSTGVDWPNNQTLCAVYRLEGNPE